MAQLRVQVITPGQSRRWIPVVGTELPDGTTALTTVADVGAPKHYNGNGEVLAATVNFAAPTKSIFINNLHATQDILVSFDGVNTYTIAAGKSLTIEAKVSSVDISASGATTPYQILTTE